MDWLAFLEKKCTEFANTGYKMDDEMFITHLLNSIPQSEYEGAILVIKEKLRKGDVELPEIEHILEDKYQAMKHVKGWDEEEDDYDLFTSQSNKKSPRKHLKDVVGTVESLDIKQQIVPTRKATKIWAKKAKTSTKKHSTKGDSKGKGHKDMSKLNALIVENMDILHKIA